jgi:hypothetical protein
MEELYILILFLIIVKFKTILFKTTQHNNMEEQFILLYILKVIS